MAELFKRAGINDDNIDDLRRRVNNMMRHMQGRDPVNYLKCSSTRIRRHLPRLESLTDDIGDVNFRLN